MTKIHLDTDIGGDMDDVCALAMLLKWPDLEITGVTTVSEEQGRRAGYVHYVLSLVGVQIFHVQPGPTSPEAIIGTNWGILPTKKTGQNP